MPWSDPHHGRVVLGATVAEACPGPRQLGDALAAFSGRQYALTYRPDTRKCYVLLKQGAGQHAVLQAAMDAHALLWMLDHHEAAAGKLPLAAAVSELGDGGSSSATGSPAPVNGCVEVGRLHRAALELGGGGGGRAEAEGGSGGSPDALRFVAAAGRDLHQQFERQAEAGGWRLHMTMLNPRDTRLALG